MGIRTLRKHFSTPYRGIIIGDVLDRGSVEKVSTRHTKAFKAYPRKETFFLPEIKEKPELIAKEIEVIYCHPAMPFFKKDTPGDALIIIGYGTGTLPGSKELFKYMERYRKENKHVIVISQVAENEIDFSLYEASSHLKELNIEAGSGYRLPEMVTYLHVLLSLEGKFLNE